MPASVFAHTLAENPAEILAPAPRNVEYYISSLLLFQDFSRQIAPKILNFLKNFYKNNFERNHL